MKKINTNDWKEFVISELFEISRPIARSQAKYTEGNVPFVASGNYNNGIVKWCMPKEDEVLDLGNCITVSPLDGSAFYQKENFLGRGGAGSAILMLRNDELTELSGLFIASVIRNALTKYSYSDQLNSQTIADETIWLPIVRNTEKPDYMHMEKYMQKILNEVDISIENLSQIKNRKERVDVKKWKRFHLYDNNLFNIDMGTKMDKAKMTELNPEVNFVGRANNNNGITTRVDKIMGVEPYEAGNMTLSLGGEYLGSCFIQPDVFYTSQNVVVLVPKWDMSFEVKQFISAMIFKESRLYYKAFVDELNRHIKTDFTFLLPVEADDKPDWKYMEQYMKDMIDVSNKVIENFELLNIC